MANDTELHSTSSSPAAESTADPNAETEVAASSVDHAAEALRFKEQWIRTAADFDNFRKRSRREVEDARKSGREDLLKDLLPVFDNLERAIASAERATDVKPVAEGLAMILRQFSDSLGRSGISRVQTVGSTFDPAIHEAIQQVESADYAPGTIVAEVQPGYMQGDRLVRAALVVVSKAKMQSTSVDTSDESRPS